MSVHAIMDERGRPSAPSAVADGAWGGASGPAADARGAGEPVRPVADNRRTPAWVQAFLARERAPQKRRAPRM